VGLGLFPFLGHLGFGRRRGRGRFGGFVGLRTHAGPLFVSGLTTMGIKSPLDLSGPLGTFSPDRTNHLPTYRDYGRDPL